MLILYSPLASFPVQTLIFSDEFTTPRNITFADKDPKWLANNFAYLHKEFCTSEDAVSMSEGAMRLEVKAQPSECHDPIDKANGKDAVRRS